jgi:hypothetical protein
MDKLTFVFIIALFLTVVFVIEMIEHFIDYAQGDEHSPTVSYILFLLALASWGYYHHLIH